MQTFGQRLWPHENKHSNLWNQYQCHWTPVPPPTKPLRESHGSGWCQISVLGRRAGRSSCKSPAYCGRGPLCSSTAPLHPHLYTEIHMHNEKVYDDKTAIMVSQSDKYQVIWLEKKHEVNDDQEQNTGTNVLRLSRSSCGQAAGKFLCQGILSASKSGHSITFCFVLKMVVFTSTSDLSIAQYH